MRAASVPPMSNHGLVSARSVWVTVWREWPTKTAAIVQGSSPMRVPRQKTGRVTFPRPAPMEMGSAGVGARRAATKPRRSPTVSKNVVLVRVAVPMRPWVVRVYRPR